ncbi:MAG: type II secretion system protein [Candidatus Paceibacterota bacterium]|jgi:prepilin-type N-terminal cleavage/methylation domain-containing protein
MKNNIRAFTLVELMVVLSIISLLSSMAMYSTAQARVKADDAKKQVEVRQVQVAITLQKDTTKKTPLNYSCAGTYCSNGTGDSVAVEGSQAYNASMQELVNNGYLSAIPNSKDDSYVYYADTNADQAAFGVELKSPNARMTNNYCPSMPVPYSSCVSTMSSGTYTPAQEGPGVVVFRDGPETASFCKTYGATSTAQCPQGGNGMFANACVGTRVSYAPGQSPLAQTGTNDASVYLAFDFVINQCSIRALVPYDITCTLNTGSVPTCSGGGSDYCACI